MWENGDNLGQAAIIMGAMSGVGLYVTTMGVVVRDWQLAVRQFWHTWSGSVWSVATVGNVDGTLVLGLRCSADGRSVTEVEVTAALGSLVESLRGTPRADGAIRRMRNLQAASPRPEDPAVARRRLRPHPFIAAVCGSALFWLGAMGLWNLG